ncbi:NBR1-Ig-like domain-containing protein [Pelolinea submarina]|uniref:Ig-like domain-containing protein n=1 Tax=Pelolinea submarina TaxID=913107 RepID=A0A347ZRQ0_9CHLR|nr:NBR1-Ig-like domain-containing protein [Pelolinea submarina]REG11465.1 Ig-like domain-containing protein [Pelolinea submarina]BBB47981.1 hypothetical protein Pelsub_P1209 [Pelolinea submarina]
MASKKKNRFLVSIILIFVLITTLACAISFNQKNNDELESLQLQLTVQALQNAAAQPVQNQSAQQPVENQSGQSQSGNNAPESQAMEEEVVEDEIPCNDSHIIGETIKDGTVFEPGETFTKSWTLRNEGDCDWTGGYALKFVEGSRMGGASSISIPSVIEPYEDITFQVDLTAPDTPGKYTGVWQLFADDGEEMGRYWVIINVENPAPLFAVTSVSTNITNKTFSGACPQAINVEVYIKANGPGTITYQPETSDLGMAPEDTITFDKAGSDTESYTWTIQNSGNYWLKVHISDPNNQTFGPYNMVVNCQ